VHQLLRKNDLVIQVEQDREKVAQQMVHYHLMNAPVVDQQQHFLGIISSETLVAIIEEEASEDLYKLSAMAPIKRSYFETPFLRLMYERSSILIVLLLAQSLSTFIIQRYEATLSGFLMLFITMLVSTGGNSSSQTSALVIQGLASGEIHEGTIRRFIFREFKMAGGIAFLLAIFGFARVYLLYHNFIGSLAVSFSLALIVLAAVALGSCMPILLRKANIDPAFAAGPFLATIMDILGLLIYCVVGYLLLG
jgi:magnesium transporter